MITEFPNGLTLIYEKSKHKLPLSVIEVYCNIGSIDEPPDLKGVAHLIEHMVFKGTKSHPTASSIFEVSIGSDFNAYTDKTLTCYYMKCLDNNLGKCLNILSDMMFHSFFHKIDFKKERDVVKEENIKNADDLESILNEEIESLIFKNTEYDLPIDTLSYHGKNALPLKRVYDYYKTHYVPSNIVISIYSNVLYSTVMSYLQKSYFFSEPNSKQPNSKQPNGKQPNKKRFFQSLLNVSAEKPSFKQIKKDSLTTYIAIGFKTCSYDNEDRYALEIFETVLSGGMNSYMFTLLRDKNGLTYTSGVDTNFYNTIGSFTLYAEVDKRKVMKNGEKKGVLPLMIQMIRYFVKHGITKKQLTDAKTILMEEHIRSLEDTETVAEHNGLEYLLKSNSLIVPYDQVFRMKYKPITVEQINVVIRRYFTDKQMNICLVG